MNLYNTLGLNKEDKPSIDDIKKAYRAKAKIHHPDKGGDASVFKEISKSYEILSDSRKRTQYDKFGTIDENPSTFSPFGNNQGFPFGQDIFDIFRNRGGSKTPNKPYPINIHLKDVFFGIVKKMKVSSVEICETCVDQRKKCTICNGEKFIHQMRRLGPGMFQKSSKPCNICNQSGYHFEKTCTVCKGTGNNTKVVIIDVNVRKGFKQDGLIQIKKNGKTYTFQINILEDATFNVDNNDLIIKHQISILESLSGFKHSIILPDRSIINISRKNVTKDKTILKMRGYGIPFDSSSNTKKINGDLYMIIDVIYPSKLSEQQIKTLNSVFKDTKCKYDSNGKNVECHIYTKDEKETYHTNNSENCRTS